jgi:hypothetical protein
MTDLVDRARALDDRHVHGIPPHPWRQPPRGGRLVIAAVVVAGVLLLLGACALLLGLGRRLGGGEVATVLVADGLEVAGQQGWTPLRPGSELPEGARIRTAARQARLRLDDGEVWLGPGGAAAVHARRVDLIRGEAVARSRGSLAVRWTDVEVVGTGTYRVTPGTNPRVGVYEGAVEVRRPAESRAVSALQQLGLAARRLPADPDPLEYRPDDPWDRELLAQAIAFDDEVDRIARGIDLRYTRAARPVAFYRAFRAVDETTIPVLQAAARESLDDGQFGPPSDVLVTLFVAEAAANLEAIPLPESTASVARRRAAGARWGLVALERHLTAQQFSQAVDLSQIEQVAAALDATLPTLPPAPAPADLVPRLTPPQPPRAISSGSSGAGREVASAPPRSSSQRSGPPPSSSSSPSPSRPDRSDEPAASLGDAPSTPAVPSAPDRRALPAAPDPVPEDSDNRSGLVGRTVESGGKAVKGTVDTLLDGAGGLLGGS